MGTKRLTALSIDEQSVEKLLSPGAVNVAVRNAHLDFASGLAVNVVRTRARTAHFSLHTMSASSTKLGRAAAKVYSATAQGAEASVLLYDLATGNLLAHIEANLLGRLRTAAVSAIGAELLAPAHASVLGIIGTGFQAEGVLAAYVDASFRRNFEKVFVYSRQESKRVDFAKRMEANLGREILPTTSAEELVRASDIVVTVTNSSQAVLEATWLKPDVHISALGSNALSRRELPPRVITSAKTLVVDSRDVAIVESGNLLAAIENGKIQLKNIPELGEVLNQQDASADRQGISILCSHGMGLQDLYAASLVYDRFIA